MLGHASEEVFAAPVPEVCSWRRPHECSLVHITHGRAMTPCLSVTSSPGIAGEGASRPVYTFCVYCGGYAAGGSP